MRLKKENIEIIKTLAKKYFGEDAKVYLFGSRIDDNKKGGDIDLYIETDVKDNIIEKKIKLIGELHKELGEQKIDIVINNFTHNKIIYQIAKEEGIPL
ncbi:MAG: nucleotidyltransferase domain-containing protein [Melioribacter sp.]|uniref:nucleotidyltransferase family protein n=1 Tax=Rosettibacter primus TaxID=3111523 RepID=UPI00247BF0A7|nr:nucleotidyltransferase domain-containing protein [Melioribacter sp.]